jgi:hypothetical protein
MCGTADDSQPVTDNPWRGRGVFHMTPAVRSTPWNRRIRRMCVWGTPAIYSQPADEVEMTSVARESRERRHGEVRGQGQSMPLVPRRVCGWGAQCAVKRSRPRLGASRTGGDVGDVVVREAAAERRHGVLAVGDLLHDGLLVEAAVEVLLERGLLQGLLRHDHVLAARVARRAVAREDSLARSRIASEGLWKAGRQAGRMDQ